MNKDYFCAYPFNTVFLAADGGIKTCCSSRMDIGNINEESIEDIIQGERVKSVRQSMIDGKWHPSCMQCKEIEEAGGGSERKHVLYEYDKFKNATNSTFILEKIDLRWSNICNLSCNYCYEYFSSHWANIKGIKVNANKEIAEEKMFCFIKQNKDTIINVNLLGGEPLLQKQNSILFDLLPDKNYYILTNLAVDLEKNSLAEKLLTMKNVDWGISFDNITDKFEYVRHGARWDVLVNNLKFLRSKTSKIINIHPVYSIYNSYNLCEFYEFLESMDFYADTYWQPLLNIQGLNAFVQNKLVKEKSLRELEKCISLYESKFNLTTLKEIKVGLEKSLNTESNSKLEFINFLNNLETNYLKNKKSKFVELWPEMFTDITKYS